MTTIEIFLIAVGLSMDAFSVAVASGAAMKDLDVGKAVKMGLFFGGFHMMMPIIGWIIGMEMRNYITTWDHWIAFGLLSFLGGNMVYESLRGEEDAAAEPSVFDTYGRSKVSRRRFRPYAYTMAAAAPAGSPQGKASPFDTKKLGILSIATSIDAMAVGLTFSMLTVSIGFPAILIGLVVFSFSVFGVVLGTRAGHLVGKHIETLGGLILIGIGCRILLEHIG
ncbi:MAG: manganese efflux pump MntP family protein [Elusimicrobiota bacterium]|nr:manganese efflux pump MntP family protein [Elusimicrobiota bacterium]